MIRLASSSEISTSSSVELPAQISREGLILESAIIERATPGEARRILA
jgi:hypothetical protein